MSNIISQHWTADQEKLEAFVLNKLDKKETSLLAAHLEKCAECRERIREERELCNGIRRFGRMEMKRRLKLRLRRDQGRRFEWIHVASLAAAIIIVLGAVFTVRWFIDFKGQKTKVQEIILSENKESQPAQQAIWIIGKVVEIKDDFAGSAPADEKQERSFADNLEVSPESPAQNEVKADEEVRSRVETSQINESEAKAESDKKSDLQNVEKLKAKEAPNPVGHSYSLSRKDINSGTRQNPPARALKKSDSGDSADSTVKDITAQIAENKKETAKAAPIAPASAVKVEKTSGLRDDNLAKRKLLMGLKKREPAKNVFVKRGDMRDLPNNLRNADPSAIQTKLERTSKGILLTFYSNAIKDTTAAYIEAVTKDSIIVSFHKKQIAYRIPGGISGGM